MDGDPVMTRPKAMFHVTSSLNRESLERRGLDWRHMGAAPGIAGSDELELEGIFLARDRFEVDWFVDMAKRRGVSEVDVWEIDVDQLRLLESAENYIFTNTRCIRPPRFMESGPSRHRCAAFPDS